MNRLTSRLFKRMLSNKGYTIDQTILIVAIIAILITLVIVTVGWQLINRSSGTKAGAQMKQIEDANGQFFSAQHVWPNQAKRTGTSTAAENMLVLAYDPAVSGTWLAANIDTAQMRNLLPGMRIVSGNVMHNFGNGGAVTMMNNRVGVGDMRLVVQFANMPYSEAVEADKAIDGAEGYNTGRVVYGTGNCLGNAGATMGTQTAATSGNVTLCYAANVIQ